MGSIEDNIRKRLYLKDNIIIFVLIILFFSIILVPCYATSFAKTHDDTSGNLTDPECIGCHLAEQGQSARPESIQQDKPLSKKSVPIINTDSVLTTGNNYTAILKVGQTPNQLGILFRGDPGDPTLGGYAGWTWWDSMFGDEKEKNLIQLMVFDNSSGTTRPVTGLASIPYWPQASYRNHSGSFSYKADIGSSPIITQKNYADKMDIWMIKKINLTSVSSANLTFWAWYEVETDWDYGYVAVYSGNKWTNLQGTLTTNNNPNGNNLGNGITGSSGGWVQETMSLTPFAGKNIYLGFRFKTDEAVNGEGIYIDDIRVTYDATTLFIDGAEIPIETKSLNVTVSYPTLTLINVTNPLTEATILQYSQGTKLVDLIEDFEHPGTYFGYFIYSPPPVDYKWYGDYYPGNYTVSLNTIINSSPVTATTQFQTTVLGCNGCHNRYSSSNLETSFIHGPASYPTGSPSCMYVCHSGSRGYYGGFHGFKPFPAVNPMHVHEMQYGHYGGFLDGNIHPQTSYNVSAHATNTTCLQCHTAFLHDNTGIDSFRIASYTLYGTNISYSSGTHSNLTCEYCHGTLEYPTIPQDQYQLHGTFGDYNPTFTSHESFTDTYILAVNGSENLSIIVTGDNTSKYVYLYAVGPVDNTSTAIQNTCDVTICVVENSLSSPIYYNITNPYIGTWIIKLASLQEGLLNYTISSNYPIQYKPIIRIPECNDCHSPTATGGTFTEYEIPDWNPGFAHSDVNGDGTLDIQCRMCHNAMHNITIKDCQECHTTAPTGHPISEPSFSQYTRSQCLACHGDPHKITAAGGGCVGCHSSNITRYYVDTSLFAGHANLNTSGGLNNVTDADCMTCHFGSSDIMMSPDEGLGAANHSNTYFCDDCHTTAGTGPIKPTNPALIKNGLSHGSTNCQWCHIAGDPLPRPLDNTLRYHPNGPGGTASGKNCLGCHYSANLPDLPFHAPGEGHSSEIEDCSYCHDQADNHGVRAMNSNIPPSISGLSVTTPINAGSPAYVQATVTDDMMQIAAAQYQVKKDSTVIKDWTNMTPTDGRFNSVSKVVNASIDTTGLLGAYTVNIKGMASAYKTNPALPYYPLNGQWSGVYGTQLIVEEPQGYDNGTVYGILGNHIAGATVSTDTGISTTTNETGFYSLSLVNGTYHLTASKEPEYYLNSSVIVTVIAHTNITTNIILDLKPTGNITGKVTVK